MRKSRYWLCALLGIILLAAGCSGSGEEGNSTGEGSLEAIEGIWQGAIQVPGQPLPITVSFTEEGGTISIPAQGVENYPLTSVELDGSALFFDMNIQNQRLTFEGEVEEETITGTFIQQGQSAPFELTAGTADKEAEDGEPIQTNVEGGVLNGLLVMPEGEGPFPVMVLIAGSGPTDKNGNSLAVPGKNNSLKMLAENLAAEGIATIRYDKRGVGDNVELGGDEADLRFDDYIQDASAWIRFAKNDERFSETGVIGHSEGSLVGMAAANEEGVDSFVSLAGVGKPIDELLHTQLEAQLPENLMTEAREILEKLKQGEQTEGVSQELQNVFRPSVQPYLISWMTYDPQEELAALEAPVLIVNGTHDLQVPVSNAELLHEAKEEAGLLIIENMNHVLKEVPEEEEKNIAAYSDPDLPLADGLIEGITAFVNN